MSLTATVTPVKQLNLEELVTSAKLNQMSWITVAITGTVDTADVSTRAVTSAKAENFGAWFEGSDTGTAGAHAVAVTSGLSAPVTGTCLFYQVGNTNTGATTLDVTASPGGAWTQADIKQSNGQDPVPGQLRANSYVLLRYDGTNWQILSLNVNPVSRYVTATGSAGSPDAFTATFGGSTGYPTATALAQLEGYPVFFKANFTGTGATTLQVDSLTAKAIVKQGDVALGSGDIQEHQVVGVIYDSTLDKFVMITPAATIDQAAVVGQSNGLVIKKASATTIDVDADDILVTNSSNQPVLLTAVNSTIDSATNGVDGLDTGSTSGAAWYYVWAVYNAADQTSGAMISLSSSSPGTGAYSWTHKALLGAVYWDGSSDFNVSHQVGRNVYLEPTAVLTAQTGQTSYGSQSISAIVPPTAREVWGYMGGQTGTGRGIAVAANASGLGEDLSNVQNAGGGAFSTYHYATRFRTVLETAQTLYWKTVDTTASAYRMHVTGYRL